MNEKEYKQHQYEIRKTIDLECQHPFCSHQGAQIAHRISQSRMYKKLYGYKVVHHNFNLVYVCGLEHNDYFNIGQNRTAEKKLVNLIKTRGAECLTTAEINDIIEFKGS